MKSEKLSFRERFCYGIGTGGEQFPFFLINIYLYMFFNVVMGIPAMTVGVIFLVARIWDAINDPMMGIIADRTRTRWGSYRPWAFFATIPMCIFITLCFAGPNFSSMSAKVAFCAVVYICFGMANTASIIPLGSMVNVMSNDFEERAILGTFREFGSSLGNCLTSIVVPAVMALGIGMGLSEVRSYTFTAFVMGMLAIVVLFFTFIGTKERYTPEVHGSFFASFKSLKGNVPAFCIIFFYFFINIAMCIRMTFNAYYAIYYLNAPGMITALLTAMSIAPFFIMGFVPALTRKWGKRNNMILGCACGVLSGILFMIGHNSIPMAYVSSFVLGLGQNLMYSGTWATLPDCADYGEYKNGISSPGFIFAIAQFGMKMAMSLGSMIISVVLTTVGFSETAAVQSDAAIHGIYVFNWISIVVFFAVGALCLIPYKLTEEKMKEVRVALDSKRKD